MDDTIKLRDGGSISLDSLIHFFRENGGQVVLGAVKAIFKEHNKTSSLEYWLRLNGAQNRNQMQAESLLVDKLLSTGYFEAAMLPCPETGRRCKGIKLRRPVSEDIASAPQYDVDHLSASGERGVANWLTEKFLNQVEKLPYVNLNARGQYIGWVSNFNVPLRDGTVLRLDLAQENDLFLLFVLATAWSRSGPWENAVYFVTWMKLFKKDSPLFWLDERLVLEEKLQSNESLQRTMERCLNPSARRKISFRSDLYASVKVLAYNWARIVDELQLMQEDRDYKNFFEFMRSIKGLGEGERRMLIKIPLIMRELRCQLYPDIPGEYCCVPDARVYEAVTALKAERGMTITLNRAHGKDVQNLLKASSKIYDLFGDLYDLPLFAYPDLSL
jgi:hypothetical protein